jgi:hypothetical protein
VQTIFTIDLRATRRTMSTELPNFNRAEYVAEPEVQLAPAYEYKDTLSAQAAHDELPEAVLFGVVAAILGCIAYATFTIVTHITIGFVALFLGAFIAKSMLRATNGVGGRNYQIAAVVLTYLSVSMAEMVMILWQLHSQGLNLSHISTRGYLTLTRIGLTSPFLDLKDNFFSGLIGLFILYLAMQSAWKVAAGSRPNR